MGALVGLGVGVGLMLIWSAFFLPRTTSTETRTTGRAAALLARAGLGQVSVTGVRRALRRLRAGGRAGRSRSSPGPRRSPSRSG